MGVKTMEHHVSQFNIESMGTSEYKVCIGIDSI
jgi:hypothetical protein